MDIDAAFHFRHKEANILAVCLLPLLLALIAVPLIKNPEIIRYLPEVMPRFNWGMVIGGIIFFGMMAAAVIAGRREEHARLRLYREATEVYRSVTPRPVTMHLWWATGQHGNSLVPYCSLRPTDAPESTPARVVRPFLHGRLKHGEELRQTVEWFADPNRSKVQVLRFADGMVAAAVPVEVPTISMPPPPRPISLPMRACLLTGSGFLFAGPAIVIFSGMIIGLSLAPAQLRYAANRLLPSHRVAGRITGIKKDPRCHGSDLLYSDGKNIESSVHVDDVTASGYPPGTPVTIEYVPYFPDSGHVLDFPPESLPTSRGEAVTIVSLVGFTILLVMAGIVLMMRQGHQRLRAIRKHNIGWATLTAVGGDPMRPLHYATLTFSLCNTAGEVQTVTLPKGIPAHWMRDIETPVLYDPTDPKQMMPLGQLMVPSGFLVLTPQGKINLHPSSLVTVLFMAVMAGGMLFLSLMLIVSV